MKRLVQRITVRARPELVFAEIAKWQDASWWPPHVPMKFTRLGGDTHIYLQEAKVPFGPKWRTRVDSIDSQKKIIRRTFLDGMFKGGSEEVAVRQANSFSELEYNFRYQIKNRLMQLAWDGIFKRMHVKNIDTILLALKEHTEKAS
ncbi:hypothetical protein ACFL5X_02915 [Candidatus Omnitrophota bacterium]